MHFGRCGNQVSADTMQKLTRTKTPAHWPRKVKQNGLLKQSSSAFSGRETKRLPYVWKDHILNINLCVKSVIPLIFTEIWRRGVRFFNKSKGVSLIYRRFAYFPVGLWKVPQEGHFIFVIFVKFTIGSIPITTMRWSSHGKFVLGLPDILFLANNTSRYIRSVKLVSVQGPIQTNLISSGQDQCNHCIAPWL